jgi:hypothetical protein
VRTNARTQVLKEAVSTSQYVVDPAAVAEAIIARSVARQILSQHARLPPVCSFPLHRGGRRSG